MEPVTEISLDYAITPTPRWGHGKPPHARLHAIMDAHRGHYAAHLQAIAACEPALKAIPIETENPSDPAWVNPWFSGLDLAALHMFVATHRPARYLEIGSGTSTKIARHAARTGGHALNIVSIDPSPRSEINALCDRVVREPVENVAGALFDDLSHGDILFIDNSHRVFTNSDSVVLLLEVLPRLKPGVLVHIHDIWLPYDYPPEWSSRYYSEQYLLAA